MKEEHFYLFEELGFYKTVNKNNVGIMNKHIQEYNIDFIVMEDRKKIYIFGQKRRKANDYLQCLTCFSKNRFGLTRSKKETIKNIMNSIIYSINEKEKTIWIK